MLIFIAEFVFFLIYGINHFAPFNGAGLILAIAAFLIAIGLVVGRVGIYAEPRRII